MAWKMLPTNYKDAVWNGLRRYIEVNNGDGSVSFQDVTQYTDFENSFFGAKDANRMNEALNVLMSMVENGTDLYTDFLEYFTQQKAEFTAYTDVVKADYRAEITEFENQQEQLFNVWMESIKSQLSGDIAGNLQNQIDNIKNTSPTMSKSQITLVAAAWIGEGDSFTQPVNLAGVEANEKIDPQPDKNVLMQLMDDGVSALYIENKDGVLTAYSLGAAPTVDLTFQVTRTGIPAGV